MDNIDAGLLLLRCVFGLFLAWHGVNKVRSGLAGTANWFGSIGMRRPVLQARAAAATEIAGGVMFAAGLLTPLAAASIIGTMLVAIVTVHWRVGFFIFLPNGGWEYCASIGVLAAAVSLAGPGAASLDNALGVAHTTTAGVAGIVTGLLVGTLHLLATWRPKGA